MSTACCLRSHLSLQVRHGFHVICWPMFILTSCLPFLNTTVERETKSESDHVEKEKAALEQITPEGKKESTKSVRKKKSILDKKESKRVGQNHMNLHVAMRLQMVSSNQPCLARGITTFAHFSPFSPFVLFVSFLAA